MFNKPLFKIEYSDVEVFCNTFGEGVRVEYKSEMIENIPKTISAFANTLGGIIIIGVETDKVQNKVIAINGIDTRAGIEESIINSSLQGIYPSVIPEVKIFEVPGKKDKIAVVIKVHESIEAPHAIQNSTRVYIRTGSVSEPYELAEISRIEYMLKRREKPEKLKDELKAAALNRTERFLRGFGTTPYFYISILPVFPYQPLISLDELYSFCRGIRYGAIENLYIDDPDRIMEGVCRFHGNQEDFLYREINHYGLIFVCETLQKVESRWQPVGTEKDKRLYVNFVHFVNIFGRALKLAQMLYDNCGYFGNLEVKIDAKNIGNEYLLYNEESFPQYDGFKAIDNSASASATIMTEDINSKLTDIVTSLMRNILWVFNCQTPNPQNRVRNIFIATRLVEKE